MIEVAQAIIALTELCFCAFGSSTRSYGKPQINLKAYRHQKLQGNDVSYQYSTPQGNIRMPEYKGVNPQGQLQYPGLYFKAHRT